MQTNDHFKKLNTEARVLKEEWTVIGLISIGHFLSHFFLIMVPSLVPLIKAELEISGLQIGLMVSIYSLSSGAGQYPMGILVDRYQPWPFVVGALSIISLAFSLMGLTSSYTPLFILAAVAGLADSTFHPADYAILTPKITGERLGRAFSVHTFSGFLGFAVGPLIVVPLANSWGWHGALMFMGLSGLVVAAAIFSKRHLFAGKAKASGERDQTKEPQTTGIFVFLMTPPILLMFLFYVMSTAANTGIANHGVATLMELYGVSFTTASTILPAFLWGIAIGVLAGGIVADRFRRFEVTATVGYLIAVMGLVLVAMTVLPFVAVIVTFFFTGFMIGGIMPSRDVMVGAITPKGAPGKTFGFVSSGFGVGGAIGPALFGWVFDQGWLTGIFVGPALLMIVTILAALIASRYRPPDAEVATALGTGIL
ncbi:MAG: MFS transporter [Candidatus Binatia bacterium]